MIALSVHQRRVLRSWVVAIAFGFGAVFLARHLWVAVPHPQPLEELSYYPSGTFLKPATLGHTETAADLAWLRAVQYYGAHRLSDNQFVRMEHVFHVLTTLSPGFVPAYVFGAFALAQEGHDFPAAERLMHEGLDANPASGELAFQMGFLYYVKPGGRDLKRAAGYFEQAARQPDGPPQSLHFAAFSRQQSGDLRVAYELWSDVAQRSGNRYLREMAERELVRIREALATGHQELAVKHLTTPIVQLRH
ncbi:MAG: tetratricopeptide repeat protein [Candidatus Eisenbacteria bacterium]